MVYHPTTFLIDTLTLGLICRKQMQQKPNGGDRIKQHDPADLLNLLSSDGNTLVIPHTVMQEMFRHKKDDMRQGMKRADGVAGLNLDTNDLRDPQTRAFATFLRNKLKEKNVRFYSSTKQFIDAGECVEARGGVAIVHTRGEQELNMQGLYPKVEKYNSETAIEQIYREVYERFAAEGGIRLPCITLHPPTREIVDRESYVAGRDRQHSSAFSPLSAVLGFGKAKVLEHDDMITMCERMGYNAQKRADAPPTGQTRFAKILEERGTSGVNLR
ncbi:MAG: hypothetical protein U1E36_05150 [Rickettsiales bacterium]